MSAVDDVTATPWSDPRHGALWPLVAARVPAGELAHDAEHLRRVYRWAVRLAHEAHADRDLCGAAALVHDCVFIAKDDALRSHGGAASAAAAPALLTQAGYLPHEISQVAAAVATSSWSKGLAPTNAIGAVLQDADRLDAIGAIGLLRSVACGQWMSRAERPGRFYDPADPLARSARALDDRRQCIDHLPAKLLRLAAGMHTPAARREAAQRHAWLLQFLAQLAHECADDSRAATAPELMSASP